MQMKTSGQFFIKKSCQLHLKDMISEGFLLDFNTVTNYFFHFVDQCWKFTMAFQMIASSWAPVYFPTADISLTSPWKYQHSCLCF